MKKASVWPLRENIPQSIEFLNTICSNLSFAGEGNRKIVLTSWNDGDGKTYMVKRIAENMALRGKRVVIISADLHNGQPEARHGKRQGLIQYLTGQAGLEAIVQPASIENVYEVPAGGRTNQTVLFFERKEFPVLMDALTKIFDLVIVDTPSMGRAIDAAEIARYCDGAVLLAKYGKTTTAEMQKMKKQLGRAGCPLLGCIINQVADTDVEGRRILRSISL